MGLDTRGDAPGGCEEILLRYARAELSPEIAIMELLVASEDALLVEQLIEQAAHAGNSERFVRLRQLWTENRAQCVRLAGLLPQQEPLSGAGLSLAASLSRCQQLFDGLVRHSEEASVALYSLGNPRILDAATQEIVALLAGLGLLSQGSRALDIGCGIGRMEVALAPHLTHVHGIDLAPEMVAVAQRRCAALQNVQISLCSGRDFSDVSAASKELVLAIDSFPYACQAGPALLHSLFSEVSRVLVANGHFVILNFSYRDDLARDAADVAALATQHGFTALELGSRPLRLWNGALFRLQRSGVPHSSG